MFQKYLCKVSLTSPGGVLFFHCFKPGKTDPLVCRRRLLHSQREAVESPCFKQEALKLLIDHGCPVDGSNEEGETVPTFAVFKNWFVKIFFGTDIFWEMKVNLEGVEELMIKRKKLLTPILMEVSNRNCELKSRKNPHVERIFVSTKNEDLFPMTHDLLFWNILSVVSPLKNMGKTPGHPMLISTPSPPSKALMRAVLENNAIGGSQMGEIFWWILWMGENHKVIISRYSTWRYIKDYQGLSRYIEVYMYVYYVWPQYFRIIQSIWDQSNESDIPVKLRGHLALGCFRAWWFAGKIAHITWQVPPLVVLTERISKCFFFLLGSWAAESMFFLW